MVVYTNTPEWQALFGDVAAVRKDLSIYISIDGTESWRFGAVLHQGPAAYSSMVPLDNGDIGVLYEAVVQGINSDRTDANTPEGIRFVRLNGELLLAAP